MQYRTHVFDFDGVLVASNRIKERAFYSTALLLGYREDYARALVEYHTNAGATGRWDRVDYFYDSIVRQTPTQSERQKFYDTVSEEIAKGMRSCPIMPGVRDYLARLKYQNGARLLVVSGVEQTELDELLEAHKFNLFFDGVYGTHNKQATLAELIACCVIETPAVYYGDTADDAKSALANNLDFVLIYGNQSEGNAIRAARDFEGF